MIEAFLTGLSQTSFLEWMAVLTGITYVLLAAIENPWCWPAGIISTALYIFICFDSNLYIESILQCFYLVLSFYGWLNWVEKKNIISFKEISKIPPFLHKKLFLICLSASPIVGFIFFHFTHAAMPFLDAAIAVFSIGATWMTARKYLENWVWWIFIDIAAMALFFSRGLALTSILYLVYTMLAMVGFFNWKKKWGTT